MQAEFQARCMEHKATNGRHYLLFGVDNPDGRPDEFSVQPSPLEYERLVEHSDDGGSSDATVGRVPVTYDDGWAIDWDALQE